MKTSVAILAGGLATRLRPLTEKFPKAMIAVQGKPFLEYQLALLRKQGLTDIVLCLGYEAQQIEDYFQDGRRFGVELQYSYDGERLLGTGGALQRALSYLSEVFVVLYGDSYLDIAYQPVIQAFLQQYQSAAPTAPLGLMTVYQNQNQWDTSNVLFQQGVILKYDKKHPTPAMQHIDWGLGILSQQAFHRFAQTEPFDLAALYEWLIAQNLLMGFEVTQRFYEIGSFQGLEEFKSYLH